MIQIDRLAARSGQKRAVATGSFAELRIETLNPDECNDRSAVATIF